MADVDPHISQRFDTELLGIRTMLLPVGWVVEEQIANAILALQTEDSVLVSETIFRDYEVNSGNHTQAGHRPAARIGPILSGGNITAHHGITVPPVNSYQLIT